MFCVSQIVSISVRTATSFALHSDLHYVQYIANINVFAIVLRFVEGSQHIGESLGLVYSFLFDKTRTRVLALKRKIQISWVIAPSSILARYTLHKSHRNDYTIPHLLDLFAQNSQLQNTDVECSTTVSDSTEDGKTKVRKKGEGCSSKIAATRNL